MGRCYECEHYRDPSAIRECLFDYDNSFVPKVPWEDLQCPNYKDDDTEELRKKVATLEAQLASKCYDCPDLGMAALVEQLRAAHIQLLKQLTETRAELRRYTGIHTGVTVKLMQNQLDMWRENVRRQEVELDAMGQELAEAKVKAEKAEYEVALAEDLRRVLGLAEDADVGVILQTVKYKNDKAQLQEALDRIESVGWWYKVEHNYPPSDKMEHFGYAVTLDDRYRVIQPFVSGGVSASMAKAAEKAATWAEKQQEISKEPQDENNQ